MNSFSLRRALLFSRLQAGEIFGGGIWKKLKVILVISVFIVLFSTLLNAGDISRSAGYAQTMILVMAIIPVTAILSDLISVRLLTPASTLEKYISVYIVALSAGAAASVALALSCSRSYPYLRNLPQNGLFCCSSGETSTSPIYFSSDSSR